MSDKPTLAERDHIICALYRHGDTQDTLANRFHLSRSRIAQILKEHNVSTDDRLKSKSPRTKFTGVLLSPEVKDALRKASSQSKEPMSVIIVSAVLSELDRRGIQIKTVADDRNVPLPLEG